LDLENGFTSAAIAAATDPQQNHKANEKDQAINSPE